MLEQLRERSDRGEERTRFPAEQDRRRDDEDVEERDAARVGAFDRNRETLREHRCREQRRKPEQVAVECGSLANETAAQASVSAPAVQTGTSTASSRGGRPARVLTRESYQPNCRSVSPVSPAYPPKTATARAASVSTA